MKQYDTILFDLDGTLLNTLEDLTDAVNFALNTLSMPLRSLAEVRSFVGNGVRRLMELSVPDGENNPLFEKAFDLFTSYYAAHSNNKTKPYDGILPLLRNLKAQGYTLAIVSNKTDAAVKVLAAKVFEDLFDAAIGEREGCARKPSPDGVFMALKEVNKDAQRAIFVGDSEVDAQTAQNAHLAFIAVLWGFRDETCLRSQGATSFAKTPEDIKNFL